MGQPQSHYTKPQSLKDELGRRLLDGDGDGTGLSDGDSAVRVASVTCSGEHEGAQQPACGAHSCDMALCSRT